MSDPIPQDDDQPAENEVMRAARLAREQAEKANEGAPDPAAKRKPAIGWKTGVGIGVGSAALLAALLYANRKRD